MSTYFDPAKPDLMVIVPPNTEAIPEAQRLGGTSLNYVGSYYISKKDKQVQSFLSGFRGTYTVDLGFSYLRCKTLFNSLIQNCSSYYIKNLAPQKKVLNLIEANLFSGNEETLFFPLEEIGLTDSTKYLKIPNSSPELKNFKTLILGDIIEMVFKRINNSSFLVFLRPRKDIEKWVIDGNLFTTWLGNNVKK